MCQSSGEIMQWMQGCVLDTQAFKVRKKVGGCALDKWGVDRVYEYVHMYVKLESWGQMLIIYCSRGPQQNYVFEVVTLCRAEIGRG